MSNETIHFLALINNYIYTIILFIIYELITDISYNDIFRFLVCFSMILTLQVIVNFFRNGHGQVITYNFFSNYLFATNFFHRQNNYCCLLQCMYKIGRFHRNYLSSLDTNLLSASLDNIQFRYPYICLYRYLISEYYQEVV